MARDTAAADPRTEALVRSAAGRADDEAVRAQLRANLVPPAMHAAMKRLSNEQLVALLREGSAELEKQFPALAKDAREHPLD
jgi:hypothetical protein